MKPLVLVLARAAEVEEVRLDDLLSVILSREMLNRVLSCQFSALVLEFPHRTFSSGYRGKSGKEVYGWPDWKKTEEVRAESLMVLKGAEFVLAAQSAGTHWLMAARSPKAEEPSPASRSPGSWNPRMCNPLSSAPPASEIYCFLLIPRPRWAVRASGMRKWDLAAQRD